jgi:hypothetical protein
VLLQSTYGLKPDDIASCVSALTETYLGVPSVVIYLVDLDQVELRALGSPRGTDVLAVDGSSAGMAFRDVEPVVERRGGRRYLWLPIVDSAERVGVLGVEDDGSVPIADWLVLTSLVGELVVSKEGYGDVISATRRRAPVSLSAELRWSLLPPLTFSSPALLVSGILQPSHRVAGDAFDYSVGPREAIVGIFDAMGHDLSAAVLADLAIGGFRRARREHRDPDDMLSDIDTTIGAHLPEGQFVTGQVLTLDTETGEATIWTAGHPPPVLLPHIGDAAPIAVQPGVPLGLGPSSYKPTTVELAPGDAVLLLSDGVFEARSPAGEFFGWDRMVTHVHDALRAGVRAPEALRLLIREVIDFQEDDVRDDATLVIVRWEPEAAGAPTAPSAAHARIS